MEVHVRGPQGPVREGRREGKREGGGRERGREGGRRKEKGSREKGWKE